MNPSAATAFALSPLCCLAIGLNPNGPRDLTTPIAALLQAIDKRLEQERQ